MTRAARMGGAWKLRGFISKRPRNDYSTTGRQNRYEALLHFHDTAHLLLK